VMQIQSTAAIISGDICLIKLKKPEE
jgi:hypothetical protein